MKYIKDFIRTYDDVIPLDICKSLIDKFDTTKASKRVNDHFNFSEILIQREEGFQEEFQYCFNAFNERVNMYVDELQIEFFPPFYGYEMFRLKKYEPNGYFNEHIDVGSVATMKRFLSFFCYLNDGGGTKFERAGVHVESKPGRLLMFPPQWMFPHEAVVDKEKFLLHTYLHFVEPRKD